jgi:hypothetical protein
MGACEVIYLWGRNVEGQSHEALYLGSPQSPGTRKLVWMRQGRGWNVDGVREFLVSTHAGAYKRNICPGNRV